MNDARNVLLKSEVRGDDSDELQSRETFLGKFLVTARFGHG